MDTESFVVTCSSCGTKNRVPRDRIKQSAKCGRCKAGLPGITTQPIAVTSQTFPVEVLQSPLPVLVDFWADWCAPCKIIGPDLEKLARNYAGRIKVVKVDTEENQALAGQYNIQAIPTLMVFQKGQLVQNVSGALPYPQLQALVESVLG